tara:strand:+ start:890 stop:1159 length:270 start_codon:yes stop_codon:yes gene_type:complete
MAVVGKVKSKAVKGKPIDDDWIQEADLREGAFTKKAEAKKMGVQAYAKQVVGKYKQMKASGKKPTKAHVKLMRQANLAINFGKIAKKSK